MHASHTPFVLGAVLGLLFAMHLSPVPDHRLRTDELSEQVVLETTPDGELIRLGIYDSRGVAIAWARSEHNDMRAQEKAYRVAKASGDAEKVAELERWGEMQQRKLHFQGFGTYPVDEYLDAINDKLPALLSTHDLAAVVWMAHAHTERVEVVDVTIDIMELLGMERAEAEKMMANLKTTEPLDFTTLFELDPMD